MTRDLATLQQQVEDLKSSVEQLKMSVRVEQGLLRALPVDVHEQRPQASQQRERCQTVVDEDAATPFSLKLAADDQLHVAARL